MYKYFIIIAVLICMPIASAQKNEIGWREGISIYGNVGGSVYYNKKYTLQNGSAIDMGVYYTRFFKNGEVDLTFSVDFYERYKQVILPIEPYTIGHYFTSFKLMYHMNNMPITERLTIGYGLGAYFADGAEEWKFADTAKDTTIREEGINIIGVSLDFPITIHIRKREYFKVAFVGNIDLFVKNLDSRLYTFTINAVYGIRF